jgi:hypothetical protein
VKVRGDELGGHRVPVAHGELAIIALHDAAGDDHLLVGVHDGVLTDCSEILVHEHAEQEERYQREGEG